MVVSKANLAVRLPSRSAISRTFGLQESLSALRGERVRSAIGLGLGAPASLACISHSRWRIVGEMAQCAAGESRAVVDTKGEYRRAHRDCVERVIIFDASARISGSWR